MLPIADPVLWRPADALHYKNPQNFNFIYVFTSKYEYGQNGENIFFEDIASFEDNKLIGTQEFPARKSFFREKGIILLLLDTWLSP